MSVPREAQGLPIGDLGFEEYRRLLEHGEQLAKQGTWIWYEREQKSAWSPNARAILGHDEEDVIWLFDLVHPDDQSIRSYDTFAFSAEPKTIEYRILRHSDRALRWIRETGVAELDDDGHTIRVYATITDVTEDHPADGPQHPARFRETRDGTSSASASPPTPVGEEVERPRVTHEIVSRVERFGLVQLVASAGAGKTAALRQAVQKLDVPTAWLTLERWDRRPGRLLDDLVDALETVVPGFRRLMAQSRDESTDPHERVRHVTRVLGRRPVVLVVDDVHLLVDAADSAELIATLVRSLPSDVRVILSGRLAVRLPGLGAAAVDPRAIIGDDVLRADLNEAAEILRSRGSETADPKWATEATGGWVAGLVFASWRGEEAAEGVDPLSDYLRNEVRPMLTPEVDAFLVACSVFGRVDSARATALAGRDARPMTATLRLTGLPAVWQDDGAFTLPPLVRDHLFAELEGGPGERLADVMSRAAAAYEREGDAELAIDSYLRAGDREAASRVLAGAIVGIVERCDVELAARYLGEITFDSEPPTVVLARLMLALVLRQNAGDALRVIDGLGDALPGVIAAEPLVGTYVVYALAAIGRVEEAAATLSLLPPGRAADTGRLILSLAARDDPDAPTPELTGDLLDAVIVRGLYSRGLIISIQTPLEGPRAAAMGIPGGYISNAPEGIGSLGRLLARFENAVDRCDVPAADDAVAELRLRRIGQWAELAEAESALRLRRDPAGALAALARLRASPAGAVPFYRELADTWEGAALLVEGGVDADAARILHEAVDSMRRGGRMLQLAAALVYLAEAEWRLGREEAADPLLDEAYRVARAQGGNRRLLLALRDFPATLSRRLDLEPSTDSIWHELGRALRGVSGPLPATVDAAAFVRQFGDPCLIHDGVPVRPKLRKSMELLSYLVSSRGGAASQSDVLMALWGGRDDVSTRSYLRQALRHLRVILPPSVTIERRNDRLAVRGAITSEELELEAHLREAGRETGRARLGLLLNVLEIAGRGLFLEGSTDAPWVDDRRASLESELSDVRLDAAELLLDDERHLDALELLESALDRDPLLERGWRIRMRALGMLGDEQGVLDSYRACRSALAEIGLEPSRTTEQLAQNLRA